MWPFLLVSALLWIGTATQPTGFVNPPEEKAPVVKSDLKYIACQTCEVLIREANRGVKNMKKEAKPGKKVTEADIFGYLEKICNPDTDEGEWIAMIDLVESGSELKLVDMQMVHWSPFALICLKSCMDEGQVGFCGTECRTLARACADLVEEIDYDLTEALFKGEQDRAALTQHFCRGTSSACAQKPPKLPADRPEGPPFVAMTEEDYKMAKMMQQMKEMGLGGRVFDQDSAQRYIEEHSGILEEDEDEDEEEEDEVFSKGASLTDTLRWAQKEAGEKVASAYETVKNTYNRWTERFRKDKSEL